MPIPVADRCLSPSDFGFHNAILEGDQRLCFVDFEYAGWDDPAKTVCDFLCQPAIARPGRPIPAAFADAVSAGLSDAATHQRRVALLLPVYRLKWCCIMLNEFLPVSGQRRTFAQDAAGQEERKRIQLEKAERALQRPGYSEPMAYVDFLSAVHKSTKRDYVARVTEFPKAEAARLAKQWDVDYWDGDRKTGYGGYRYDGRWRKVADAMVQHYGIKPGDRILDVGCGKGFLLYDFTQAVPGVEVAGIDISAYAIATPRKRSSPASR